MSFAKSPRLAVVTACVFAVAGLVQAAPATHFDEPGFNPGREYVHQGFAEHIDPFNGNLELHYVDLYLPGNGGFDIKVQRSYNSIRATDTHSPYGRGWDIHFGRIKRDPGATCAAATAQSMTLELPDGTPQVLYKSNAGLAGTVATDYITLQLWKGQCVAGGIAMFAPDGTRYDMTEADDDAWLVKTITDRNGNRADFNYETSTLTVGSITKSRRVIKTVSVTSPAIDAKLVTFTYVSGRLATMNAHGRTWTYSVPSNNDGSPKLASVTPPESAWGWQYEYFENSPSPGSHALRTATYPHDGTVAYTYNFVNFLPGVVPAQQWTVVETKRTSDGNWDFRYAPGPTSYDTTTVTDPMGHTYEYQHYGHGMVLAGQMWKMGLLYKKVTREGGLEVQAETYDWTTLTAPISNEDLSRPNYKAIDTQINRPLLKSRKVTRGISFETVYSDWDQYGNAKTVNELGNASRETTRTFYNNTNSGRWILGLLKSENVGGSRLTSREYNADGSGKIDSEAIDGVTTSFSYHSDGALLRRTNARGNATTFSSYFRGIPRTESRPEAVTITRTVDDFGNVKSETDGEYNWLYSYDGLNRITNVNPPRGNSITVDWRVDSRTVTRGALVEVSFFDPYGRVERMTRTSIPGNYKTFAYDALGRKKFESLPASTSGITTTLDVLGRPKTIKSPGDTYTKSFTYQSSSVSVKNERDKTTVFGYVRYGDPDAGYLTSIDGPGDGADVTMTRDAVGRLKSATQGGVTRTYTYLNGFLATITEPETGVTQLGRDQVGNLTSKTVDGVTNSFTYDGLDRMDSANRGSTEAIEFDYDPRGHLKAMTSASIVRAYTFDENGNLTFDKLTVDGLQFDVEYRYDANDKLSTLVYPMQKGQVAYSPDALGRPTTASPFLSSIGYFNSGNLASMVYANQIRLEFDEDNRQFPTEVSSPNTSLQLKMVYSYDGVGNVNSISSQVPNESRVFSYDDVDRLTAATGPWGATSEIKYSSSGNIELQKFGAYQINYQYSAAKNTLSSISGSRAQSYGHDGRGNVTSIGSMLLEYDKASRLQCARCGTADEIRYRYDGQGRRVSEEKAGRVTYFAQAPNGDLQFEYTPYGKVWTKQVFVHGKRIASEADSDATPTVTSLTFSPASPAYGAPLTLNASVSPSATGVVEFWEGEALLGSVALSSSQANLAISTLAVGPHEIVAKFVGNANMAPSESAVHSVNVVKRASTTGLQATPLTGSVGQRVTLAAEVSGTAPTGEVAFLKDGVQFAVATLVSGSASVQSTELSAGNHVYAVTYAGDGNHNASVSVNRTVTIDRVSAPTSLSVTPLTIGYGSVLSVNAAVAGIAGFVPTGTVTLKDGAATLATLTLVGGTASFATSSLAVGTHSLMASYAGDANYLPTDSAVAMVQVETAATTTVLTPLVAKPLYSNQLLTLSAQVQGAGGATGTVVFRDGSRDIASATLSGGVATVTSQVSRPACAPGASCPPAYTAQISANYAGDANNRSSASPAASLMLRPGQAPQDFNLDGMADMLWFRPSDRMAAALQMNDIVRDPASPSFGQGAAGSDVIGSGDFDGDGRSDLMWFRLGDRVMSIQFFAGGTQDIGIASAAWELRAIADFNGDGKSDLLWFNPVTRGTSVQIMNGATVVENTTAYGVGQPDFELLGAADFSGDGKADLLWYRPADRVVSVQVNGGATANAGVAGQGRQLRGIADVNGDGRADLVWFHADRTALAWLMEGSSVIATPSLGQGAAGYELVGAADFNGDGKADPMWIRASDRMMSLQRPDNSFADIGTAGLGWELRGAFGDLPMRAARTVKLRRMFDLNRDGHADVLATHTDGSLAAWLFYGPAILDSAPLQGAGSGWSVAGAGDFNADGKGDVLLKHTDGSTQLRLMNGFDAISTTTLIAAGTGWSVKLVGDFNGDGKSDILWEHTDGRSANWLMDGATQVGGAALLAAGTGWTARLVADFNGDGKSDILWEHTDGRSANWLMDGATQIGGTALLSAGTGWSARFTPDLNGDGKADIVWQHTDGRWANWLMDGATQVGGAAMFAAGSGMTLTHVGDLNADGKADLVWRSATGVVTGWLMDGAVKSSEAVLSGGDAGWSVVRMADFNGDGRSDLLWRYTDGAMSCSTMNALSALSTAVVAGPGSWSAVPLGY